MKKITTIGAVALTAGCFLAASSPAWSATGTSVDELIPVLSVPQTAADIAPASLDLEALGGIQADTVRYLGDDEVGQYWIGQTSNMDVCLITHVPGGYETSASNCATIATFNQYGLGILAGEDLNDPTRSVEAYYFPADIADSFVGSDRDVASLRSRSANDVRDSDLVAGPSGSLHMERENVERPDGSSFHFQPLGSEK